MFIPPTSSHHCHHLAHAAFRLHHICCVLLGGANRHAAAPVGGSDPTTVGPRTSRPLGRGPFRPIAHPRRLVQTGARAPLVAGVGRFLGLGLGRESLEVNGHGEDAIGGHRSLPPCRSKTWPAAVGKRTRTQPPCPSTVCTRSLTPLSFQPQRHITMILGRPVMVHMWSKNLRAIL